MHRWPTLTAIIELSDIRALTRAVRWRARFLTIRALTRAVRWRARFLTILPYRLCSARASILAEGRQFLESLCGHDERLWKQALDSARNAIQLRVRLWDGVVSEIRRNQ